MPKIPRTTSPLESDRVEEVGSNRGVGAAVSATSNATLLLGIGDGVADGDGVAVRIAWAGLRDGVGRGVGGALGAGVGGAVGRGVARVGVDTGPTWKVTVFFRGGFPPLVG